MFQDVYCITIDLTARAVEVKKFDENGSANGMRGKINSSWLDDSKLTTNEIGAHAFRKVPPFSLKMGKQISFLRKTVFLFLILF